MIVLEWIEENVTQQEAEEQLAKIRKLASQYRAFSIVVSKPFLDYLYKERINASITELYATDEHNMYIQISKRITIEG